MTDTMKIFLAMAGYMCAVIGIGIYFARKANKNAENYFLGGRSLGPWVAAMSAEASDMSGWLLMGLPGVAYWCGIADASWTAIGLALGTYVNWLIVSKRLRNYSKVSGDAITVPEFFSNRFHENTKVIRIIASLFILIFFTVYAGSCFVTCGKLFSTLFDLPYTYMMIAGALFVIFYTLIGGFLAESASDFMQSIVMIFALVVVLALGVVNAGGIGAVLENARSIPGYFSFTEIAQPIVNADGTQLVENGKALFGSSADYPVLTVFSMLAWGLGYFGMPQVLLRFMAIRKASELKKSRRIATVWVVISLFAAVAIGIVGRAFVGTNEALLSKGNAENVFVIMSQTLLHPVFAGVIMAGILAATISSSDSYLLIASSALANDIYKGVVKKDANDKTVMWISRIALVIISVIGVLIALDEDSVIFNIVSFAWAGFGATFGPLMLFSLFWKRINRAGAIAGMLVGGSMVFIWKFLIAGFGGAFAIYELLPAFICSSIAIVVVSLLTKKPSAEIEEEFEKAKAGNVE